MAALTYTEAAALNERQLLAILVSGQRADGSSYTAQTGSATTGGLVTPSDDDDGIHDADDAVILDGAGQPKPARALATQFDADGVVRVTTADGDDLVLPGEFLKGGVPFPIAVTRIWGTGTTNTVPLYWFA